MGTKMGPNYANLFFAFVKNKSSNNTRIPSPINFVNNFHVHLIQNKIKRLRKSK